MNVPISLPCVCVRLPVRVRVRLTHALPNNLHDDTQQMSLRAQHIVGGTLATSTHTQQMSWRAQHIFGRSPRKLAYTFGGGEAAVLEEEAV